MEYRNEDVERVESGSKTQLANTLRPKMVGIVNDSNPSLGAKTGSGMKYATFDGGDVEYKSVKITNMAGTGTRNVGVDSNGNLIESAIPNTGDTLWEIDGTKVKPKLDKGVSVGNPTVDNKPKGIVVVGKPVTTDVNPVMSGFATSGYNDEYVEVGTRDAGSGYGTFPYYENVTGLGTLYLLREGWWWLVTTNLTAPEWANASAYGAGGKDNPEGDYTGYNEESTTEGITCKIGTATEIDSIISEGSIYSHCMIKSATGFTVDDGTFVGDSTLGSGEDIIVRLDDKTTQVGDAHVTKYPTREISTDVVTRGCMAAVSVPQDYRTLDEASLHSDTIFNNLDGILRPAEALSGTVNIDCAVNAINFYNMPVVVDYATINFVGNKESFFHTNMTFVYNTATLNGDTFVFIKSLVNESDGAVTLNLTGGITLYYQDKDADINIVTDGVSNYIRTYWESSTPIPDNGTTNQVLVKKSNSDFDLEWKTVDTSGKQRLDLTFGKMGNVWLNTILSPDMRYGSLISALPIPVGFQITGYSMEVGAYSSSVNNGTILVNFRRISNSGGPYTAPIGSTSGDSVYTMGPNDIPNSNGATYYSYTYNSPATNILMDPPTASPSSYFAVISSQNLSSIENVIVTLHCEAL